MSFPSIDIPSRRSTRARQTDKLTKYLEAEKADDDGNPRLQRRPQTSGARPRVKKVAESVSDEEDDDFDMPELVDVSDSSDCGDSDDETSPIDNDEVSTRFVSASWLIPLRLRISSPPKRFRLVEEIPPSRTPARNRL